MMQQNISDRFASERLPDACPEASTTRRPRAATMSERVHRLRILGRDGSAG